MQNSSDRHEELDSAGNVSFVRLAFADFPHVTKSYHSSSFTCMVVKIQQIFPGLPISMVAEALTVAKGDCNEAVTFLLNPGKLRKYLLLHFN